MEVCAKVNIVGVVDLNENIASLRRNLKESFLEIVLRLIVVIFVVCS